MDQDQKPRRGRPRMTRKLISPVDVGLQFGSLADAKNPERLIPIGQVAFYWERNPEFPAYLRKVRETAGVSMQDAAEMIQYSQAGLSRLETGETQKVPSIHTLTMLAQVYGVDAQEMLHYAGIRLETDYDFQAENEARFRIVFLDKDLRPSLITEDIIPFISDRMKVAILDFAQKLAKKDNPEAYLQALLAKAVDKS